MATGVSKGPAMEVAVTEHSPEAVQVGSGRGARAEPQTGGQGGAQAFKEETRRSRACADVGTSQAREPD